MINPDHWTDDVEYVDEPAWLLLALLFGLVVTFGALMWVIT